MTIKKPTIGSMSGTATKFGAATPPVADRLTRAPRRIANEPASGTEPLARPSEPETAVAGSKVVQVILLLCRMKGATLAELVAATGWQPHSARAVLSGLRKKGHAISKAKQDGVTRYSIAGDAQ